MRSFFVTRHRGAVDWARKAGIEAEHVAHLDISAIRQGDRVFGTLPISMVAQVCESGGRYFHLTLDIPSADRGRELSVEDMERFGAKLEEFTARKVA